MSTSPIIEETNLVSYEILSGGSEIPSTYEVLDIRIEQYVNRVAEAEITLRDGSTADQTFEITDADTFKPGAEIEIKLGYDNTTETIYKGIVTKQNIKIDDISGSRLQITCRDKTLKLAINRKNAIFTESKDSDIITKIAGDYSLDTSITATTVQHKEIVQYYTSDWDMIMTRSEVNGMIVVTDNGKLTVAKPAVSATPDLQVTYGYDIIEFDGELDASYQYSGVQANAWDMANQNIINSTASEPTVNEQGDLTGSTLASVLDAGTRNLNSSVPITQEDTKTWADASLLKSRLSRFKGVITFHGSAKAKPNTTIKLIGLGTRFNGNAYISGVTHTVQHGRWDSEVKIGLSTEWFSESHNVTSPDASGIIPGVKGLQTGVVKKIDGDPDNEFRVEVEVPILGVDSETIWARLATFYAGNGIGAYFMPEVNDEVILGFMNDDPRFPVILGSVFSSKIAAPETPDENNTIKTLITQSKLQLKFDDENKVITILTPGGNKIVLSDQDKGITITDQNENQIQMNDSGIIIESKSKLTIKASEEIDIQAPTVKTTADESLEGTGGTVKFTGNESTTITGSAECTISSDGETSVKGSIVKVN